MNNPIMALAQMAMNRISSTGAVPVVISTNPLLYIKRVS